MGDRLGETWERRATQWTAWARTPGHDVYFTRLNWPAFEQLLPAPGRLTLDLGCGEGRLGRLLQPAGHRLGLDSSPTLAGARYRQLRRVSTDTSAIPLDDRAVDLVVAFMSLHDMDDPAAAIAECARVLEPGGLLIAAIVTSTPRGTAGGLLRAPARSGFGREQRPEMTFESIDRPSSILQCGGASRSRD